MMTITVCLDQGLIMLLQSFSLSLYISITNSVWAHKLHRNKQRMHLLILHSKITACTDALITETPIIYLVVYLLVVLAI